jgi:multiple sugar transport system substrate-binding protein
MTDQPTAPSILAPRRGLSRRAFLHTAGLTTAGLLFGGACTPDSTTPSPNAVGRVQLVYQDWKTEWFPSMAQEMIAGFQAEHPGTSVFYTPDQDNLGEEMLASMQAGTAPDVFQGCCDYFPVWAQQNYVLDLRPFVEADLDQETIDDWDRAQYASFFLPDGRQYGLPKYHGALALYYNKDLFDAYGVPYPSDTWNHDDYLDAMRALTHDRDDDGQTDLWGSMLEPIWDRLQIHINAWGGHLVDPDDPTRCLLAEPEALEALEWVRARMWDDNVMAAPLDVHNMGTRQAFVAERVAMVEDGSWALKDILAGANFRVGVTPMPAGPARRVTLATTDGFGIYARTRHPDMAWALLKFLISKDYGRAMARANFLQPARASLLDDWAGFIRAEFPEKAADLEISAFADGHLNGYSVTTEVFPNMAQATRLAASAWDQIFVLGQAPVDIMQQLARDIEGAQATSS